MNKQYKTIGILITATIALILIIKKFFFGKSIQQSDDTFGRIIKPTQILRSDPMGSGLYGASRGTRSHKGLDILATKSDDVYAPFSGLITRAFQVYSTDKRWLGVELTDNNGLTCKIMYMTPDSSLIGLRVVKGQEIGLVQGINEKYGKLMKNHLHVEVLENGEHVNPSKYIILD